MAEALLLVVEDEPDILELLSTCLRYEGFEVVGAAGGAAALAAVRRNRPDLVVLDILLPDMDGFEVVRRLRSGGDQTPVVFLTARDGVEDRLRGFTLGGDDYVTKPFHLAEVVARVRAVLKRLAAGRQAPPPRLVFGDIELDDETHEVWRDGTLVPLSPTEFNLLRFFMENAGRVMSKRQILDHVWHHGFQGDAGIIEKYVYALRRKVDYRDPRCIHTVRGVGYVLRHPR